MKIQFDKNHFRWSLSVKKMRSMKLREKKEEKNHIKFLLFGCVAHTEHSHYLFKHEQSWEKEIFFLFSYNLQWLFGGKRNSENVFIVVSSATYLWVLAWVISSMSLSLYANMCIYIRLNSNSKIFSPQKTW